MLMLDTKTSRVSFIESRTDGARFFFTAPCAPNIIGEAKEVFEDGWLTKFKEVVKEHSECTARMIKKPVTVIKG